MDPQQVSQNKSTPLSGIVLFIGGMFIGIGILAGIFFLIYNSNEKKQAIPSQNTNVAQQNNSVTLGATAPAVENIQLTQAAKAPQAAPTAVVVPQAQAKKVEVQTCALRKETSSLVDKVAVFNNGISGTFRGVATKVINNDTNKLAILELTSRDKTQVHTFDVQASNATLFRLTKTSIDMSEDIHVGSPIIIGFKCSPKYENKFIITFIQTAAD